MPLRIMKWNIKSILFWEDNGNHWLSFVHILFSSPMTGPIVFATCVYVRGYVESHPLALHLCIMARVASVWWSLNANKQCTTSSSTPQKGGRLAPVAVGFQKKYFSNNKGESNTTRTPDYSIRFQPFILFSSSSKPHTNLLLLLFEL